MNLFDAELVQQLSQRVGGEGKIVALNRRLVRLAESGLVHDQRPEMGSEHRQVPAEVRPARGAGSATVQHHHHRPGAGLLVVQLHIMASIWPSTPNSPRPNMDRARSGSLIACTRPAWASRQNRWIGVPT